MQAITVYQAHLKAQAASLAVLIEYSSYYSFELYCFAASLVIPWSLTLAAVDVLSFHQAPGILSIVVIGFWVCKLPMLPYIPPSNHHNIIIPIRTYKDNNTTLSQ